MELRRAHEGLVVFEAAFYSDQMLISRRKRSNNEMREDKGGESRLRKS